MKSLSQRLNAIEDATRLLAKMRAIGPELITDVLRGRPITQTQLAKEMGISKSYINKLLRGGRGLNVKTFLGLLDARRSDKP